MQKSVRTPPNSRNGACHVFATRYTNWNTNRTIFPRLIASCRRPKRRKSFASDAASRCETGVSAWRCHNTWSSSKRAMVDLRHLLLDRLLDAVDLHADV